MKEAYAIVLTKCESDYVVYVPDFQINTEGKTVPEAIEMARDAISMTGICWEDLGKELPAPTAIGAIQEAGDIVTLVDVDFAAYRKKNDTKAVRRNVSLPSWLDQKATEAGINVSAVLQKALQAELGLA